jgi:uncharacterized protein
VPPVAREKLAAAPALAVEVDLETADPMVVLNKALLPEDQSLDKLLGPEAFSRLRDYVRGVMPLLVLERVRPWFAANLAIVKASAGQLQRDVMDVALLKQSRAAGKRLVFLETLLEQLEMMDNVMDANAVIALTKDLDNLTKEIQAMTVAYRKGDVAALEAMLSESANGEFSREQFRALFGARNERWVPLVEKLAAEGGGFVAVGAGHLLGKDGIVPLLRARGHRVTRVLPGPTSPQLPH